MALAPLPTAPAACWSGGRCGAPSTPTHTQESTHLSEVMYQCSLAAGCQATQPTWQEEQEAESMWACLAPAPPPPRRPSTPGIDSLPPELLGAVVEAVLQDDAAHQRRPVLQFVSRPWLDAYRCCAYRRVRLDVGAALAALQRRGHTEAAAAAIVLAGLAARLPYAAEVRLQGLPLDAAAGVPAQLRWHLGELLLFSLHCNARLHSLATDFVPRLPRLLEMRAQRGLRLEALGLAALPAAALMHHLPLLRRQPLTALAVPNAAGLPDGDSLLVGAALASLTSLTSLRLGGSGGKAAPGSTGSSGGACLPSLALVASAAALPGLQQLELSLTFGKRQSSVQQEYLHHLGCVLHQQRAQRAAAHAAGGASPPDGSHVSVTVHEHVQGDLSAVPVASCSLNLDWDDDSNPFSVWQCATLRHLRIVAQLPLSPGAFRPARLAALEHLAIAGCCHIPAYFAEALGSMSRLTRLEMSDCLPVAVAAVPWQVVLPRLPALQTVAVERCPGATQLASLWMGLAACPHLHHLTITGCCIGGGLPPPPQLALPCAAACCSGPAAAAPGVVAGPRTPCPNEQQAAAAAEAAEARTVPDTIALLQHLRSLDLSGNGLTSLPHGLAWCQQLTRLCLAGNALRRVPPGLASLGGLRSLDLSSNQLCSLAPGPYWCQLESLRLEGNMPMPPTAFPVQLLQRGRLRCLSLPTWWQLMPEETVAPMLLRLMPWLALSHC